MKEWADFLISEVKYDPNHLILMAKRYEEFETGIKAAGLVDRIQISSDIANGLTYMTIYDRKSNWKKGNKIRFFRIRGQPFLRIDENKVNQDYLGDIPELKTPLTTESGATPEEIAHLEQLEKQIELELRPHKEEIVTPKVSRGTLPKENAAELPQELDLAPEPVVEPEATPEPATPKVSRGTLPKENAAELPQELDLAPEPVVEPEATPEPEEATPEQIARLEQLEKQIEELESQSSKEEPVVEPDATPEPEEATPEQIARLEQLGKQIEELESQTKKKPKTTKKSKKPKKKTSKKQSKTSRTVSESEPSPEQLARLEKLEKQITDLETRENSKTND